jgi:hypothetical protein
MADIRPERSYIDFRPAWERYLIAGVKDTCNNGSDQGVLGCINAKTANLFASQCPDEGSKGGIQRSDAVREADPMDEETSYDLSGLALVNFHRNRSYHDHYSASRSRFRSSGMSDTLVIMHPATQISVGRSCVKKNWRNRHQMN